MVNISMSLDFIAQDQLSDEFHTFNVYKSFKSGDHTRIIERYANILMRAKLIQKENSPVKYQISKDLISYFDKYKSEWT